MIPQGGDNPNRYRINAEDDRALNAYGTDTEPARAYFAIATALDALTDGQPDGVTITRDVWLALDPYTRKALRTAEGALRRAAFSIVVHARHAEGSDR